MLYVIGLGLGDCKDITVKGLEIIRKCDRVYLESYTSILGCSTEELEEFYGQKPIIADRELVEQYADVILEGAGEKNIAFLVVGDPFGATTHTDLILRAKQTNIKVKVIHNASIMNAVGCCGLQLYTFGETISIPYWTDSWKPDSFFEKILSNFKRNLHTLCLLDIKVKEPTLESLTKKKREYMPPVFMSVKEASAQLLEILDKHKDNEPDAQFSNGREWRNEEYCGISFTKRIIGGNLSSERKYPWIGRLGYRTKIKGRYLFLCGGTLINQKFVITAAHCLGYKDPLEIVRLGETTIICASPTCKDPRVQQVFVKKASKHPKFSETNGFADIAVLELAHPVQYTDFVRPICLSNTELAAVGGNGIVAGFGIENYITRERPDGLKELQMTIIPGSKCKDHFPKSDFNSKNFICAGGKEGEDTCNGDSGGPLMQVFNTGNGARMHLMGTVSFGSFKCGVGVPGIFTSIHFHWKWIMQVVLS